jgi:hypothetical protein|tara:strand:+ start:291 stop:905 length:615 start_codon:yes stop_codon:yes gene_type:complete
MSGVVATQVDSDASVEEIDENATANQKTEILNALATEVVMPGQLYRQSSKLDFGGLLMAGSQGGFEVKGTRTTVNGMPGSVVRKQIVVNGTAVLSNMTLVCDGNTPAVVVRDGGRVALKNCHIVKGDNKHSAATDAYILMETGSYASVVSCVFYGTQSNTGSLVYNQDAVNTNRGSVIGCINLTDIAAAPFVNIVAGNILGVVP